MFCVFHWGFCVFGLCSKCVPVCSRPAETIIHRLHRFSQISGTRMVTLVVGGRMPLGWPQHFSSKVLGSSLRSEFSDVPFSPSRWVRTGLGLASDPDQSRNSRNCRDRRSGPIHLQDRRVLRDLRQLVSIACGILHQTIPFINSQLTIT